MFKRADAFIAATMFSLIACASSHKMLSSRTGATVVEVQGDGVKLQGYLFLPDDAPKPAPAIIVLHGWGGNAMTVAGVAQTLSRQGYVALALSMRGWYGSEGVDDCGLKQPADIASVIEHLTDQSYVLRDHIGLLGFSQGGQVALLTAALNPKVKAVVAYYPVTNINEWQKTTKAESVKLYISGNCHRGTTSARSPTHFASKINAEVLLIHGDADRRVPLDQSQLMKEALEKHGKSVELKIISGGTHGFSDEHAQIAWEWATAFLKKSLRNEIPQ